MENKLANFMFEGVGVPQFKKYLDLASLRHKLISGNVANASTPGYRASDIDFQEEFARATARTNHVSGVTTDSNHIALGQHRDRAPDVDEVKIKEGDMNSVNIDEEISEMAQNELLFSVGARLLQKKFDGLRKVITSK